MRGNHARNGDGGYGEYTVRTIAETAICVLLRMGAGLVRRALVEGDALGPFCELVVSAPVAHITGYFVVKENNGGRILPYHPLSLHFG